MKDRINIMSYQNPLKLVVIIVSTIFTAELVIMIMMENLFFDATPFVEALFDSLVLITIVIPLIYLVVYRPLKTEKQYLESLVEERTEVLRSANENLEGEIIDRIKAEDALRQNEHRLKAITDSAFEGIALINMGKLVDCNSQLGRILGYTREEMILMDIVNIVAPESQKEVIEYISSKHHQPYEFTAMRKDSSTVFVEACGKDLSYMEKEVMVLAIRDLSDRKKAENAAKLASIGELAAGVAHEINNPAQGIMLNSQLLMDHPEMPEGKIVLTAQSINEDSLRISIIVKSLLSFSRTQESEKSIIDFDTILQDVLILMRKHINRSSIILRRTVEDNLPGIVVNKQEIEQVFINLISNAIHALDQKYPAYDDNKILVLAAETQHSIKGLFLKITFTDQGVGIEEAILGKIMEPFFSTKIEGSGTGLGLSISNTIVKKHGGTMSISSSEGEYTKVEILLPGESMA